MVKAVYYGLQRTSTPAPVVPLTELISHMRLIANDAQSPELQAKARYAVEYIEEHTGHVGNPTSYLMTLARWPLVGGELAGPQVIASGPIQVPRSPLISVESISYVDTNGTRQTLASNQYQIRRTTEPAIIAPSRMNFWPLSDPWTIDSIQIAFTAGYGNPSLVPERYKEAVKFLTAYRFFNRESDEGNDLPASLKILISSLDIGVIE